MFLSLIATQFDDDSVPEIMSCLLWCCEMYNEIKAMQVNQKQILSCGRDWVTTVLNSRVAGLSRLLFGVYLAFSQIYYLRTESA